MVKMKKLVLILILFLFALSSFAVECGDTFTQSLSLDNNLECPSDAVILEGDDIDFDCNNFSIKGSLSGNGIVVSGREITVTGCEVFNFENGFLVKDSSSVTVAASNLRNNLNGAFVENSASVSFQNNMIHDNTNFGVYSLDVVDGDYYNNDFSNTGIEVLDLHNKEQPEESGAQIIEEQAEKPVNQSEGQVQEPEKVIDQPETPRIVEVSSQITDAVLEEIGLPKWKHDEVKDKVSVHKTATIYKNRTIYKITATPSEDLKDASLYELMPEEVDESDIKSSESFVTLKEGRVLKFSIGNIEEGEDVVIEYELSRHMFEGFHADPFSVFAIESVLNPSGLLSVQILTGLLIILFIVNYFLKKRVHPHLKYRGIETVLILCVLIFVIMKIEIQIAISEKLHNIIVFIVLNLLMIYFIYKDYRYYRELREEQKEGLDV